MAICRILLSYFRRLVALALTLASLTPAGCVRRVVSIEEVDEMIKDQVPAGSDKQRVKTFIDNLKVDSLKISRGEYYKTTFRPAGTWDPQKIAELWDRTAELISARILDTQTGFLNRNDIFIEFAIDKDGRMLGYTVKMMGAE